MSLLVELMSPIWFGKKSRKVGLEKYGKHLHGKILDIGCGFQQVRNKIKSESYIAIDVDKNVKNLNAIANGFHLPFKNNHFDSAICLQVLEHVPDPIGFLKEIKRVMKPGGYLYVSIPHINPLHQEPHDYYRFTHHALKYLGKESGLEAIDVEKIFGLFATVGYLLNWSFWQPTIKVYEKLKNFGVPEFFAKIPLRIFYPLYFISNVFFFALDKLLHSEKVPLEYICLYRKVE